ncbi:DUF680 domain-containing protein [Mesorhizobium sp. M3A.F.Ca.ET.080.04.2.1]|uniref:DUF680 domain-containing protein n=1 Tax=Mesorhizobium sp. M3A.F.Ca.ET.080.04.2.1 TaxID=2493676 RepID=UPI000F759823|nr:DUF680 domain-containing protein [Mesorhizobium sp. M3A.F.Ca.ET.080.04.2.1]AZO09131.1 DUF680 domain-containing protein [Mesorhizobium sp. M3A.F.Ca.ET.080.04.2.1]RWF26153.1 MAG: DUF680 domain-containing protein [Mesorhizobium sp.]
MKRTVFTLAAIIFATGSALAGSDHYDANNAQPVAAVDTTRTGSLAKPEIARHRPTTAVKPAPEEPGQGIWGR